MVLKFNIIIINCLHNNELSGHFWPTIWNNQNSKVAKIGKLVKLQNNQRVDNEKIRAVRETYCVIMPSLSAL